MPHEAVVATTSLLPNGHQFTVADLHQFAAIWRPHFLYREHRMGAAPLARVVGMRVGSLPNDPETQALYIIFEPLAGVSDPELDEQLLAGYSLAFFGHGVSNVSGEEGLRIGLSPSLAPDEDELASHLQDLGEAFPNVGVAVLQYHQHAAQELGTLIVVVKWWLVAKVGDKLFDLVWDRLFARPKNTQALPQRVVVRIERQAGATVVEVPVVGDGANVKIAVREVLRDLPSTVESHTEVSVEYDASGSRTMRSTPMSLPPPDTD